MNKLFDIRIEASAAYSVCMCVCARARVYGGGRGGNFELRRKCHISVIRVKCHINDILSSYIVRETLSCR